jgi:hypothetical protein
MWLTLLGLLRKLAALSIVLWATDLENISAEKKGIVLASPSFRMIRVNQLKLQINLRTARENTKMLAMLKLSANTVGADVSQAPTLAVLEQAPQPEKVVEQKSSIRRHRKTNVSLRPL